MPTASYTRRTSLAGALALALCCMAAASPSRADTVKVGIVASFSGPFARWGEQFQQAIRVYQKQHGTSVDGNPIELIYRDDGGPDPVRAKQLTTQLIVRDKVQFLSGYVFTPNALAVADVVTDSKTPTILMNTPTAIVVGKSPYFVRDSHTLPQVSVPIAQWAAKQGVKRVVTAVSDYAAGYDSEAAFSAAFEQAGGKVLESIHIPLSTTDFSPYFERILQDKPDALFIFGPGGPPSINMVNAWASRLKPAGIELLCTAEVQQIDLPRFGPAALDVVSSFHYTETLDNLLNKALLADLTEMFGKDAMPDLASVAAYDAMELIYRAVAKFGPHVTGDQAIGLWRGMKFDSPRGPIEIDPDTRDIVQNIYFRKVEERDGKLVNINFDMVPMMHPPAPSAPK